MTFRPPKSVRRCDCGRRARPNDCQCSRCALLDGAGAVQRWIIAYLTETYDPVPTPELAWWAGYEIGATYRSVLRALVTLKKRGRLETIKADRMGNAAPWGNYGSFATREVTAYRLVGVK